MQCVRVMTTQKLTGWLSSVQTYSNFHQCHHLLIKTTKLFRIISIFYFYFNVFSMKLFWIKDLLNFNAINPSFTGLYQTCSVFNLVFGDRITCLMILNRGVIYLRCAFYFWGVWRNKIYILASIQRRVACRSMIGHVWTPDCDLNTIIYV